MNENCLAATDVNIDMKIVVYDVIISLLLLDKIPVKNIYVLNYFVSKP